MNGLLLGKRAGIVADDGAVGRDVVAVEPGLEDGLVVLGVVGIALEVIDIDEVGGREGPDRAFTDRAVGRLLVHAPEIGLAAFQGTGAVRGPGLLAAEDVRRQGIGVGHRVGINAQVHLMPHRVLAGAPAESQVQCRVHSAVQRLGPEGGARPQPKCVYKLSSDHFLLAARRLPGDRDVVAAGAFLHAGLNVVAPAGLEGDGLRLLLGKLAPLLWVGPAGHIRNSDGVGGIFVGTQQQVRIVVTGDPERVVP